MKLTLSVDAPSDWLEQLPIIDGAEWSARGEAMALRLFHEMSERVPAYKNFLQKHKINPTNIKSTKALKSVPVLDKDNYLRMYSLSDLSWDGNYSRGAWTISSTSGSTGTPYYFPRQSEQDDQYALLAEMYLKTNFHIDKMRTLYIVAFPMGAWIGGLFTYEALQIMRKRGNYNLSIITPGINKTEILNAFKRLAPDYDQVIIGSYAPFLKDIIDDGLREGIAWSTHKLGFIFSAEGFTEQFRDYVVKKTGLTNIYTDTLNHYGTVDLGTMSYETPLAILIRRLAAKNKELYKELFQHHQKMPTLTQYIPELFYFEAENNALLCSARSGIPLVRYNLHDSGGICTSGQIHDLFAAHGISLKHEVAQAGIKETVWDLPFVYVYERSDFSVSFFAT